MAAVRADEGGFGEGLGGVVTAFDVDIGAELVDQGFGGVFVEGDGGVDGSEGAEHGEAVIERVDGPVRGFLEPSDAVVGVDSDNEGVSESARGLEVRDVAGVEDIENAVREDDGFAGAVEGEHGFVWQSRVVWVVRVFGFGGGGGRGG